MKMPKEVCNQIDKICRDFLWELNEEEKKIHLINRDIVCKPTELGGLGLCKAQESNNLFLMKLAWGLIHDGQALWVKVMKSKYGCGDSLIPKVMDRTNCSNAWKGIVKVWNQCQSNLIWHIGDGKSIEFWTAHWIPRIANLSELSFIQIDKHIKDDTLDNYAWMLGLGEDLPICPEEVTNLIHTMKAPHPSLGLDSIRWLPDPQEERGLKDNGNFPRCIDHEENLLHVLRDCPFFQNI
ncbi:Putative ribonuclease H protein [Arachis hypogaea]|nr:Putative ribonuclease H protein [Arachis hypogaea]